jgi:polysaccharide deacetylase 2 family uncharacterized protein YibQ
MPQRDSRVAPERISLRDELNEPLPRAPKRSPAGARLAPIARWGARLVVAALVVGAGALYWRVTTPRPPEVAVIPYSAIKTVVPAPPAPAAAPVVKVYPPQGDGGVSVVSNGAPGAVAASGPEIIDVAQALGRQPAAAGDGRMIEASKYGPLPRIAADGSRPSQVYAHPFSETAMMRGAPRIAVFVGGLGLDPDTTDAAISRLPAGVSLGLAPYGLDLSRTAARARGAGHEIWLQAPMEGVSGPDPGPHTLRTEASAAQNEDSLHWLMARFVGYVGVANYLGAKFTADPSAVSPTLAEIARRGLIYLDDGSSALSKVGDLAPGLNLKTARADVIAEGDIDDALARAEDIARRRGSAIVVASALPLTVDHVARWAQGLEAKGFTLAPVSALVSARPDRTAGASP